MEQPQEFLKKLNLMYKQTTELTNTTPPHVYCECGEILAMAFEGYRCLYCDIIYCKSCAEKHFGQTVEEFKKGEAGHI